MGRYDEDERESYLNYYRQIQEQRETKEYIYNRHTITLYT